jgi:23S rRNA A1618 N6-methylase RlmF
MKTRKELKEEYKKMKFKMGVYQIRNKINGKIFISSTLDLNAAWNSQKFQLNFGSHKNEELQKEWKEFGEESFVYEIVDELKHIEDKEMNYNEEIKVLENMLIEELQPFGNRGYNKRKKI